MPARSEHDPSHGRDGPEAATRPGPEAGAPVTPAHAFEVLDAALGRRAVLRAGGALALTGALGAHAAAPAAAHGGFPILQNGVGRVDGTYVTATPETVRWGLLPGRDAAPVAEVPPGALVTIDTVAHEGILEDQGRDPVTYFRDHGVAREAVLDDAVGVAGSPIEHPPDNGPHVVIGPVRVTGAQPGDVLAVRMLTVVPRVPYGVVTNRHAKGALPGEMPEEVVGLPETEPFLNAGGNVSVFTPVSGTHGSYTGTMPAGAGTVRFGLAPFLGLAGVTWDTDVEPNSIPPTVAGGNLDVNDLTEGSVLYLPVQVPGAGFFVGDPTTSRATARSRSPRWRGRCASPSNWTCCAAGATRCPAAGRR